MENRKRLYPNRLQIHKEGQEEAPSSPFAGLFFMLMGGFSDETARTDQCQFQEHVSNHQKMALFGQGHLFKGDCLQRLRRHQKAGESARHRPGAGRGGLSAKGHRHHRPGQKAADRLG